jgi:hypothetical protein
MRTLFEALLLALFIIGIHAFAALVITYVPWLGVFLFAWVFTGIVLALLSALGVTSIDLSQLRSTTQRR